MKATGDRLSIHDTIYLAYSSEQLPLGVAGLFLLRADETGAVLTLDRLRAHFARRLHLLPRFTQVVRGVPFGLAPPLWIDDPHFSIERHVSAERLPPPGATPELQAVVRRLNARFLDPLYPLWHAHAISGLAEDGAALLLRAHHTMVDGMSGIHAIRTLFDFGGHAADEAFEGAGRQRPNREPNPLELLGGAAEDLVRHPLGQGATWKRDRLDRLDEFATLLDGWLSLIEATEGKPRLPSGRGPARWAAIWFPERELRRAAHVHGAALNEIVPALVVAGVAHVLAARGEALPGDMLRVLVPIVRPSEARVSGLGNHSAYYIVRLPVGPLDEDARLAATLEALREGRASRQFEAVSLGIDWMERMPLTLSLLLAGLGALPDKIDAIVSFMPGPRRTASIAGLPVRATFPVLPLGPRVRLVVGAAAMGGVVGVGVTAGADTVPELDLLVHGIERAARRLGVTGGGVGVETAGR
jgi:diacylglycerol O-acyltransferase / wax synthase